MRPQLILIGVVVACAAISPLIGGMNPYYYDILIGIGISIILAAGLNLVNGYTGQFSLGHAGFMGVGAYLGSALSLAIKFPMVAWPEWGAPSLFWILRALEWVLTIVLRLLAFVHNLLVDGAQLLPFWAQFLAALAYGGAVAALAGFTVGVPSLRLKGDYLAIVTLGFNEIIKGLIQNAEPLGAQRGLGGMMAYTNFFWTFAFAALTVYVVVNLVNSTYGRGFLAVRDDEIAAESMGINTTKYKVLAFVLGAFFAGIAGGLYAHFKQFIHPEGFNFMKSVDVVVMVILGGMGSTVGVCIAAVLLTVLPELLRYVSRIDALPDWLQKVAENRMILYSLLLVILMLTRPQGLFGSRAAVRKKA